MKLGQSALLKLMKVVLEDLVFVMLAVSLMVIGRWSELRTWSTDQWQVGRRLAVAMVTSGAVEEMLVILVGTSSLRTPILVSLIQLASWSPLLSGVSSVFQRPLWAFMSPTMRAKSPRPSLM